MPQMAICAGIDGGSRAVKVTLMERPSLRKLASGVADQGVDCRAVARKLLEELLAANGLARRDIARIVATGYARGAIDFADETVTEITCQALGVKHSVGEVSTVIDIGGQDSKVIWLDPDGTVRDFVMNDRCAAGTGRFLEMVASRLGVDLEGLGRLALRAQHPVRISSTCAVFAETEIVGMLSSGAAPEDIAAGVQASVASRIAAMACGKAERPVVLTGGVALVAGMAEAIGRKLGADVTVAPDPQTTCALGAAIIACTP